MSRPWQNTTLTEDTNLAKLAQKFNTTARAIVEANGVRWSSAAIDAWVLARGGGQFSSGETFFRKGNRIKLPLTKVPALHAGMPWGLLLLGSAVGYLVLSALKKDDSDV